MTTGAALRILLVVVIAGWVYPGHLTAQQAQRGPLTADERQQLERRVRQQFDQRLRDGMGLDSEEEARFGRLVQDFRDRRLELSLEQRLLRVRLRREGRREDLTNDEAREMLDESLRLGDQEAALFREEQAAFLTILDPAQLVQLYQWREALTQRLRRLPGGGGASDSGSGLSDWP